MPKQAKTKIAQTLQTTLDLSEAKAFLPAKSVLDSSPLISPQVPLHENMTIGGTGLTLSQATVLNWLGQAPISFHRIYADVAGGIVPGLYLSHLLNRVSHALPTEFDGNDYVFVMPFTECETVTSITRNQQISCRKSLIDAGLLSEHIPYKKNTYRLHMQAVAEAMARASNYLAEGKNKRDSSSLA